VKQICGSRVYSQFARDAVDYQRDLNVRPVKSRMSAFVDRFSMTKSSSESAERMRKPGIRLGLTIEDFSDDRSMFIEK